MRILITGMMGFVGPHLVTALRNEFGESVNIILTGRTRAIHSTLGDILSLDVTNIHEVRQRISDAAPTHILHLAAVAEPVRAAGDPDAAWSVNVFGARNVAQAVIDCAPQCWLLFIGSGLIYGASARSEGRLTEATPINPVDEYGVTKAAADLSMGVMARRGLKAIRLRPFNHTGAGQSNAFVVPAFAEQIARIERRLQPPVLRVGNLDSERDFLDVRDVARAYALLVRNCERCEPGCVLNIASGEAARIKDLLLRMMHLSEASIQIELDPARLRPSDVSRMVGDSEALRALTGWKPMHTLDETLGSVLDYYRRRVG